ncbi:MAG: D-alanyl-D-alanine carboxypeptidase family protein [Acidimicrobiia bacterium]|nr:D-alanyl-D-alanine carboxypeptidase family protein [Acidimicrobiia bacterium]
MLVLLASLLAGDFGAQAVVPDLVPSLYAPFGISETAREEIPPDLLGLYREVAASAPCAIPWPVLAGIADTATDHGRVQNAERRPNGSLYPMIVGPPLDGQGGRRLVADTDGGRWDDDVVWDRALGLFQFIPATWSAYAGDGNGDGVRDPQNVWDEAVAAANHLCDEGADDPATVADAVTVYYATDHFVPDVLSAALRYITPGRPPTNRADTIGVVTVGEGGGLVLVRDVTDPTEAATVGSPGDRPVIGDWDGDGDDDIGVARFIEGVNALVLGPGDAPESELVVVGQPGDVTMAADWDGDGTDEAAVFRSFNGQGRFLRFDGAGEALGPVDFGQRGDQPLVGDWDGDGTDEPAVYRAATGDETGWFLRADGQGNQLGTPIAAGRPGDQAVVGDWDGDGIDTLGLQRPRRPDGTEPVFVSYDRDGAADGTPQILPVDGIVVAGRAPAVEVPAEVPEVAPEGTEALVATAGVEFFGVRSGPDGVLLRLWRVNGIIVEEGIVSNVAAMVAAAGAEGINLTAWGWRSHEQQIELRRQNCANVFDAPASSCRPPTAIPGTSRHEVGRALDVHVDGQAISASSPVFAWLRDHAADFGLFNLPSESWHWSDTGG